jgi:hypothetical protein
MTLRLLTHMLSVTLLASCVVTRAVAQAQVGDLETLLEGVSEIGAPGLPGSLAVYGNQAFPVIVGASTSGAREPVVAAGRLMRGRVVAFGHNGYLNNDLSSNADTQRFLANVLVWAAAGKPKARLGVVGIKGLATRLQAMGFSAADIAFGAFTGYDVVIPDIGISRTREESDLLLTYVRDGGGVVAGMPGWGWAQTNSSLSLAEDFFGNWLMSAAGIVWAHPTLSQTSTLGYSVVRVPPDFTHAQRALDALTATGRVLTSDERTQISVTLNVALSAIPSADTSFVPAVNAALQSAGVQTMPTPQTPVKDSNILGRLAVTNDFRLMSKAAPAQITAHPSAATFPGAVPATAVRVSRAVPIRTARPRWHSTGLYAPAGEIITVRVPTAAVKGNFAVRIGAHSDRLWSVDTWRRFPEISVRTLITAAETQFASAFGGLIYIEVPETTKVADFSAEISGGVLAPRFVKGKTTLQEWRDTVRNYPAPWGEVETSKMIVTTQTAVLRNLDDPSAVADAWDRVLDATADLATIPRERTSPERFVCDEQISAGGMHSGYPLMCHLDSRSKLIEAAYITGIFNSKLQNSWGFFHEIGHNHQNGDWTFDGTGEVTVNLFPLHTFEVVGREPVAENARGSLAFRQMQMRKFNFVRPDFELWKSDPFLALTMYVQLQQAFGWGAYKAVFAEYLALEAAERPKNDQQKRDQWMVRFSRRIGRNLGPFFQLWGIPTTEAARESIVNLPVWIPDEMLVNYAQPVPSQQVTAGESFTLSVQAVAAPTPTYQWTKDGVAIPGATASSYRAPSTSLTDAGTYRVVVTIGTRTTTSEAAVITVVAANPGRLINLSLLTALASPTDSFTMGTVIGGSGTLGTKPVLVRAAGPSLGAFGVGGTLGDPNLEFFADSTKIGENNDWGGTNVISNAFAAVGAFPYNALTSKDAALFSPAIAPGSYSIRVTGNSGTTGTVIAELYDSTPINAFTTTSPRFVNVSALKQIGSGFTVGFVIGGATPCTVLVRAVGPGLAAVGVASGFAANPRLVLFAGSNRIQENDDWGGTTALTAAMTQVGAFAIPPASKDAALLATLQPGSYSVQVSAPTDTVGLVIAEVYVLP